MPPSLSELKVTPSFCFPIKIRDDRAVTINQTIKLDMAGPLREPLVLSTQIHLFHFFLIKVETSEEAVEEDEPASEDEVDEDDAERSWKR